MTSLEATLSQNVLYEKILTKYKNLKKEKEVVCQDYCKLEKEYEIYKIKEQSKLLDLQKENNKLNKIIHELKTENKTFSTKLTMRDHELKDLNSRFEIKINLEEKNKERDFNLFSKLMGRKPIITNSQDSKFLTIISTYENQIEKAKKTIKDLENNLITIKRNTPTASIIPDDFQSKNSKIIQKQLLEKIEKIGNEKICMEEENHNINENFNKMKIEFDKLTIKQEDLYKVIDRLKSQNTLLQQKNNENKENITQNIPFGNKSNGNENFSKKNDNFNEINLLQVFYH